MKRVFLVALFLGSVTVAISGASTKETETKDAGNVSEPTSAGEAVTVTAATSDSSTSSSHFEKGFAPKISAPHNGSFTYSIDIREPAFRGLEPNVKLDYDSSQGIANNAAHQNWLGLGWSVGGFSVIERASPGRGTPFFNDSLDTFLLDGAEWARQRDTEDQS
jgi:hypothetical protein